jgi:lipopolysaccharide export LptBFGC system permease protein LptF
MQTPIVEWTQPDHSWHMLWADHAVRANGVWTFFDVQLYQESGPHSAPTPTGATNILAMPEFDETPERIRLLLEFAATKTLGSGNPDIPLAELWEFQESNPGLSAEDAHALATKFYGRLAAPWTCLVVVLVAIPFGAPAGRRNLFFGVAGSIFIGFAYFILQRVSLALGVNGQLPGWLAAWLPNLLFAGAGILLTWRVR